MKKFALLTNYSKDRKLVYTRLIETYITENGGTHWVPEHISEPDDDGDQRYDLSDMPTDIACANAAKAGSCFIRRGKAKPLPQADYNIRSLKEIKKILK